MSIERDEGVKTIEIRVRQVFHWTRCSFEQVYAFL